MGVVLVKGFGSTSGSSGGSSGGGSAGGDGGNYAPLDHTHPELVALINAKQDPPVKGTLTIPVTGWTSDAGIGGRFKQVVTIALADLAATDKVDLLLADDASAAAASACGLADWAESLAGGVKIRATKVPTQAFSVQYEITKA